MVEHSNIKAPAIIIADRNYESYNTLELIARKGWKYLIRLRKTAGFLSNLQLPEGDFDIPVQLYLTRKQNKAVKALQKEHPGIYRFLPVNVNLSLLPAGSSELYPFFFQIVHFKIYDDSIETLITNLD